MEHVSNWKTGKLFHLGPFFYGRRFPEIVMNLQIVSAVPKLHFSANSYLSDENHSAVTKALASSGCYSSNGIFPQRLSRRGLGVKIRLIPSILLQLGQFQLLPGSCALWRFGLLRDASKCHGLLEHLFRRKRTQTEPCGIKSEGGTNSLEMEGLVEDPRWKLGRIHLGQDRLGKCGRIATGRAASRQLLSASYQI